MTSRASFLTLLVLATGAALAVDNSHAVSAQGQGLAVGRPDWTPAVYHDTSRPLRDLPSGPMVSTRPDFKVMRPPLADQGGTDPVRQSFAVAPMAATPGNSFDGIGEGVYGFNVNYAPPDTVGEAGKTQYVQWVNVAFAVFDKATGVIAPGFPKAGNTIWAGFPGDCSTHNDGDPIVQYDQLADRWILTQFSVASGNYLQCVAVSTTSDATGTYNRYAFSYADFPDYPKLSVWPDAYYITFNMFRNGVTFSGGRVCAYDRARMLAGLSATQQCVQTGYASLLPSDLEGKTLPPVGTPNYVVNRGGSTTLNLWKFHVDWATPANSTLTGPTAITVANHSVACGGGACIPQKGTLDKLDSLGDRLMYRLAYRKLTDDHEALVVNHSVVSGSTTGIRWYEIDVQGGSPAVHQQGTYGPDGLYRWMGSIAMDSGGNIAVGYSTSSSTTNPAIKFAGWEAGSNLGLGILSAETPIWDGGGSQAGTSQRWGDYSTLSVDPVDDCTFWFTTEYLKADGSFNWNTRIGSFKFTSCGPQTPAFSLGATPSTQTIVQGQSTTFDASVTAQSGYTGSGNFSVTGLPANTGSSFSPAGYTGGNGSTVLAVTTASNTPAGTYALTIAATDTNGTPTQTTGVTLVVNPPPAFTLTASPGSRTITQGQSTTFGASVTAQNGYTGGGSFSVSGLPSGASGSFSPATYSGGSGSTTLTVITASNTPVGTYALTIKATGTNLPDQTTGVTLVVSAAPVAGDFAISVSPGNRTVKRGNSGAYTVTITPSGGFNEVVTFSVSGLPSSTTSAFSPSSFAGGGSTTLTIGTANPSTPKGTSTLTITASSASKTHSATVTLKVQ